MKKGYIVLTEKMYIRLIKASWQSGTNGIPLKDILKLHTDGLHLSKKFQKEDGGVK